MSASNSFILSTIAPYGSFKTNVLFESGVEYGRIEVSGVRYTGKATDFVIGCMFTGNSLVVLPPHLTNTIIIKDESGNAGSFNIWISGGPNIDGVTGVAISGNYGSVTCYRSPYGWRTV